MEELRDKINNILKDQNLSSFNEKEFRELFDDALDQHLENSYLAHFNFAIQELIRVRLNRVTPIVYDIVDYLPSKRKATVRFKEGGYIISTIRSISNEERRVCIAHELSHILISSLNEKIFNPVLNSDDKNDKTREIIAQILSFFMLTKQSLFYTHHSSEYIYDTDEKLKRILSMCIK